MGGVKKRTRVLICEDYPLFREGIKAVLRKDPSIEVVGEAKNGREGVEMSLNLDPEVVILDISLPEISGLEATRRIKRANKRIKILILTTHDEQELVLRCLDAGASAHMLKDVPPAQLIIALKAIARESIYLDPDLPKNAFPPPSRGSHGRVAGRNLLAAHYPLTNRETEVLIMIAEGCTVKEVASRLRLEIKTIDSHKYRLMRKLDIHNKTDLIKYAIRENLIDLHL